MRVGAGLVWDSLNREKPRVLSLTGCLYHLSSCARVLWGTFPGRGLPLPTVGRGTWLKAREGPSAFAGSTPLCPPVRTPVPHPFAFTVSSPTSGVRTPQRGRLTGLPRQRASCILDAQPPGPGSGHGLRCDGHACSTRRAGGRGQGLARHSGRGSESGQHRLLFNAQAAKWALWPALCAQGRGGLAGPSAGDRGGMSPELSCLEQAEQVGSGIQRCTVLHTSRGWWTGLVCDGGSDRGPGICGMPIIHALLSPGSLPPCFLI